MIAKVAVRGMILGILLSNSMLAPSLVLANDGAQAAILLNQMDALQQEVMTLRDLVEQQTNTIEQIQKEGRDRYLDLDRRISQLTQQLQKSADKPTTSTQPTTTSATKATGDALYHTAFQSIRERRFDDAVSQLKSYLQTYPKGTYAGNSQYWLGEVYLAQGSLDAAEKEFTRLLSVYPQDGKVPDALYKLGQVNDRLGQKSKAKTFLERVIAEHPSSASARLAKVYLENM